MEAPLFVANGYSRCTHISSNHYSKRTQSVAEANNGAKKTRISSKYKGTFVCNIITSQRSHLKQLANKRHKDEKNYMATLEAVGLSTATYTGDTAMETDCDEVDGNEIRRWLGS